MNAARARRWLQRWLFRICRLHFHWRKRTREVRRRNNTPSDEHFAILIHSFDGYRRFWGPAAWCAERHLACGFPVYFATEEKPVSSGAVLSLLTGRGSFLTRLRRAVLTLKRTGVRYLLYLQEDMWISEAQSRSTLAGLVDLMREHELDSLKLGKFSFWNHGPDSDLPAIRDTTEALPSERWKGEFTWFGPRRFSMSHHVTLFDVDFLLETIRVGLICRKTDPFAHETLASRYIGRHAVSHGDDGKKYRIATWRNRPVIPYVHACEMGRLTEEGRRFLEANGIESLYAPSLPGEEYRDSQETS